MERTEEAMKWVLFFVFLLNLFVRGSSMRHMMCLFRPLQLILHLPLLKVEFPQTVKMFFSLLVPIVMFDVIEASSSTELFIDFDYNGQD